MNRSALYELQGELEVLAAVLDEVLEKDVLSEDVDEAAQQIAETLGHPPDLVDRQIAVQSSSPRHAHAMYLSLGVGDGLASEGVLLPYLEGDSSPNDMIVGQLKELSFVHQAAQAILDNQAVLGMSGWEHWWAVDVAKPPMRNIQEPPNNKVVHGPHSGFIENWAVNLSLLRQIVRSRFLRVETQTVGFWTNTTVVLIYLEGQTPEAVVRWARNKIQKMGIRGLVDSSRIAMALGGAMLVPTMQYSERPDQVAAALLQGRVAIMVDQSPSVLLVPARLSDLMTSPADYYQVPVTGSMTRLLRYGGLLVATTLPAIYVSALTVNPSFIPLPLYLTTVRTRLSIPFPAIIETILMLLVVDMVQEAGLIMPGALGQTVTIFGTLILGDAAIKAGIVSAPTLITVTIAMLAQFLIPDANLSGVVRIIRYGLIPLAAIFGFTGIISGWMILLGLGVQLSSAGVPYLAPLAPARPGGWRDTLLRIPRHLRADKIGPS